MNEGVSECAGECIRGCEQASTRDLPQSRVCERLRRCVVLI